MRVKEFIPFPNSKFYSPYKKELLVKSSSFFVFNLSPKMLQYKSRLKNGAENDKYRKQLG